MPLTGTSFLIGAIAISGLPFLNGFFSEFLIYFGAFKWGITSDTSIALNSIAIIMSLAIIGGFSVATYTKAFGTVFLGHPRTHLSQEIKDPSIFMTLPMVFLSSCCFIIGLFPVFFISHLKGVLDPILSFHTQSSASLSHFMPVLMTPLDYISFFGASFFAFILFLIILRHFLQSGKKISSAVTWDCGYALPTHKMQYSASSFNEPLIKPFKFLLGRKKILPLSDYFPKAFTFHSVTADVFKDRFYSHLFQRIDKTLYHFRRFQYGRIQLYIFYILLTLVLLIMWQLDWNL